ncbi:MAG: hypothetical protein MJ176_02235 [Treponema sp.]|nr:hypothetical protein [Treponema sp.]
MKKLLISTSLILLLAGCSFQIPKTVTVKSNAKYSFNILSYEKDLSDLLGTEKLLEAFSSDEKMKSYDYNPGGNSEFQQVLMEYPFYDAAIDFSEYTKDMKLDEIADGFSIDKSFTFSSQNQINSLITPMGVYGMTVNGQVFNGNSFTFDLTQENAAVNAKFQSIKYSAGKMRVYYKDMGTCSGVTLSTSLNTETRSSSGTSVWGSKNVSIPGVGTYTFEKYYDVPFTPSGETDFAFSDLTITLTGGVSAFYCEVIGGVIEGISASAQFDDFDPVIHQTETLSGISESINSVTFADGNGLKITYDNTLPAGNDITLKASCDFMDIPADTPVTIAANTSNGTATLSGTSHSAHSLNPAPSMVFDGTLYLPGVSLSAAGDDLKKAVLTDVKPGETYRIKITAEPVIEWSKVEVNVPDQDLEDTVNTGLNLGSLLDSYLDADTKSKMTFEGVESRIYLEKPDNAGTLFNSISFEGDIKIKLSDDSRTETMTLDGFKDPVKLEKRGDTVITNVSAKPASAEKDLSAFFKTALNSSADIDLYYKIKMNGRNVPITKAEYDTMTNGTSDKPHLRAVAYIIVPMRFKIDGSATPAAPDAKIDLNNLAGLGNDDILGRTSYGDNSAYDAVEMIEKVGVHYNLSSLPLYTNDSAFSVEFDLGTINELGTKTSTPKLLAIKGDTLTLSNAEITDFIRCKTVPTIKLVLKDGKTYGLKRNANKKITANAGIDFHVNGYVKMGIGADGEAIEFGGAE